MTRREARPSGMFARLAPSPLSNVLRSIDNVSANARGVERVTHAPAKCVELSLRLCRLRPVNDSGAHARQLIIFAAEDEEEHKVFNAKDVAACVESVFFCL